MPDVVDQTMGDGNQFNIDQVNDLVDNGQQQLACHLQWRQRWIVV